VPAAKLVGVTLLIVGVAFHNVTLLVALALESTADAAPIVIAFEFGKLAGAV
jgi:hypothetical protein